MVGGLPWLDFQVPSTCSQIKLGLREVSATSPSQPKVYKPHSQANVYAHGVRQYDTAKDFCAASLGSCVGGTIAQTQHIGMSDTTLDTSKYLKNFDIIRLIAKTKESYRKPLHA